MTEKIVLFGLTQTADIVQYYLEKYTDFKVCARCVDKEYITNISNFQIPIVAFEEVEKLYPPSEYKMAIPIMHQDLNRLRENKYLKAKEKGYNFISYINPISTVETKDVGENVFVLGMCHIQPFVKIGNNCMIWSGTEIGHHTVIHDNCFITGARIAGRIKIGKNCFIGHTSMLRDGITIGEYSVIGMGSVIQRNVKPYSVYSVKQTKNWEISSEEAKEII